MKLVSKRIFAGFAVLLLAAPVFAVSTNASASHAARVTTDYIDAKISLDYPGFAGLSVDSLGKEDFPLVTVEPPTKPWRPVKAECKGSRVEYRGTNALPSEPPRWAIEIETNEILLESRWSADDPPEPLVLDADSRVSHVTLLGLMETNGSIRLPALMHFADQGTFRIFANLEHADPLAYATTRKDVKITFPAATREHPLLSYCLKAVVIHPQIPDIAADARFDGFRRDWLNIFQINPQRRVLANNAGSDSCGYCYYEYGDIAEQTPPLAKGLTALDLVRQTLDQVITGAIVCGMPGYTPGRPEEHPESTADTLPSFLIAAEDYVSVSKDESWLVTNYDKLKSWTDQMLATDTNGDGLIKHFVSGNSGSWPEKIKYRPANWWDTIGFGHEDAYANALAYRALLGMEKLARQSSHAGDSARYRAAADKLKAAYFKTFYNPATGILAGWRSADGQLHDYYFLWVNGIAIHYGLVPKDRANEIMDRLLAKMKEAGYTNFALGLPGNLIPVARKDYVDLRVRFGGGTNENNSDGFQIYENGGATACFAYYTLAALYDLGRIQDGDRILFPILDSFIKADFQGFCDNKMSKDWKTWGGECHGYEGFLNDNYYALLAVLDREAALEKKAADSAGTARQSTRVTTDYIDAKISLGYPGFAGLSVDSLGKEHFPLVTMKPPAQPWRPTQATRQDSRVEYRRPGRVDSEPPRWAIEIGTNEIGLESHWSADDPPEPLVLDADSRVSHVTLLGLMETNGSIQLPALMHFPDQGTFRISVSLEHTDPLSYATTRKNSKITFPAATGINIGSPQAGAGEILEFTDGVGGGVEFYRVAVY